MKQSRRHYGIGFDMPFREGKDPEEKSFFYDFDNQKYCRHRVKWLISKVCLSRIVSGDKVEIDKRLGRQDFPRHFQEDKCCDDIYS